MYKHHLFLNTPSPPKKQLACSGFPFLTPPYISAWLYYGIMQKRHNSNLLKTDVQFNTLMVSNIPAWWIIVLWLKTLFLDYTHTAWQQKSPLQVYELGPNCKSILKIMAVCHVNLDFRGPDGSCCSSKQFSLEFVKKKEKKKAQRMSVISHEPYWQ